MDQIGKKENKAEKAGQFGPETGLETGPEVEVTRETERADEAEEREEREEVGSAEPALQVAAAPTVPAKEAARDPLLMEVERKLEADLLDAYRSMSPGLRAKFKAEGERIASVAREGIASGKLAAENLLTMIINWLRMIPHVDRWFLVQDAKLKTDALIRMAEGRQDR